MQIVRNKRIPGRERPLRPFEGLYGLSLLFNLFLVSSVGIFAVYAIVLLIANYVSPSLLKDMDETMTNKIVIELASKHNYESAIALMDVTLDSEQRDRLDNRFRLGFCYEKTGMYSHAIEHYEYLRSAQMGKNDSMRKAHQFVLSRRLCHLYINVGDLARADECWTMMRNLYADSLRGSITEYCENLLREHGVGFTDDYSWYSLSPIYEQALINYSEAPETSIATLSRYISEEIKGSDLSTNSQLMLLNTLINWKLEQKTDAKPDVDTAVSLSDKAFYMDQFEQFGALAYYCKAIGDNEHYDKLMSAYKRYLLNSHKRTDPEALSVVKYLVEKKRYYQADGLLNRICSNLRDKIRSNIPIMSDEQRDLYVKTLEEPFAYAEELMTKHPSPRLARTVAENALFKKGLLLRSNRSQRVAVQSIKDHNILAEYDELITLKKEYSIVKNLDRPEDIIRKTLLKKRIYQIDKSISAACANYVSSQLQADMSVKSLRKALGRRDSYVYLSSNREKKLFALLITREKNAVYFPIGEENSIPKAALENPDYLYDDLEITRSLLGDLSFSNKGKRTYYCSTSGLYNRIALPSLLVSEKKHLMDIADIRFVSDPSIISRNKNEEGKTFELVSLWGGVRYSENDKPDGIISHNHRAISRGEHLVYLQNSLSEVQSIVNVLTSGNNNQFVCNLYTDWDATEESFKARDGKEDYILHISTHGFFNDTTSTMSSEMAMDNSGLLFAGAEKYWKSDSTHVNIENEGILKASEIELMNLNGCRLVVLSACETGLGHEENSEGVYGLQRAFKLAGADQILMSLWEVPDKETSILMKLFYRGLVDGYEPDVALELAQKKIREKISYPESWGGFIILN